MTTIIKGKSIHKYLKDVPMVIEELINVHISSTKDFVENYDKIVQKLDMVFAEPECYLLVEWLKSNKENIAIGEYFVVNFNGSRNDFIELAKNTMSVDLYNLLVK